MLLRSSDRPCSCGLAWVSTVSVTVRLRSFSFGKVFGSRSRSDRSTKLRGFWFPIHRKAVDRELQKPSNYSRLVHCVCTMITGSSVHSVHYLTLSYKKTPLRCARGHLCSFRDWRHLKVHKPGSFLNSTQQSTAIGMPGFAAAHCFTLCSKREGALGRRGGQLNLKRVGRVVVPVHATGGSSISQIMEVEVCAGCGKNAARGIPGKLVLDPERQKLGREARRERQVVQLPVGA